MDPRRTATDLAYVAIGFAVLGFQRVQVRRREIERFARSATRAQSREAQAK